MQKEKFDYSCFNKSIWKIVVAISFTALIVMNFHSLMQLQIVKIALYIISIPISFVVLAIIKWLIPFEKFPNIKWINSLNTFFSKWDKIFIDKITENAKYHEEFILGDVTEKVGCFSNWIAFMLRKFDLSEDKVQKVYVKTVNFSLLSFLFSVIIGIVLIVKWVISLIGDLVKPMNWFFGILFKLTGIAFVFRFLIYNIKQSRFYKAMIKFFSNFAKKHPILTATVFILGLIGFGFIIEFFAISGGFMMAKGYLIIGSILYSGKIFTVPYMIDYYRKYRDYMIRAEYFAYREDEVIEKYLWMKTLSYYRTVIAFMDHIKNTVKMITKKLLNLIFQIKNNIMYRLFNVTLVEISELSFKEQVNFIMQKEEGLITRFILFFAKYPILIMFIFVIVIYLIKS